LPTPVSKEKSMRKNTLIGIALLLVTQSQLSSQPVVLQNPRAPKRVVAVNAPLTNAIVTGIFSAANTVTVAPGADGRILAIPVREGQMVSTGTIILRLDDREQRARVELAATAANSDAEIRMANIRHSEANARLSGTQKAASTGAATSWEVRQAEAATQQAAMEGKVARDRQGIEAKRANLERLVLENFAVRAPFNGRVTQINSRPGASVRKGQSLVTLVDMSKLRSEAFVPAKHYGLLKVGDSYQVKFAAPFNMSGRATLTYIDPVLNAGSFRAVFQFDNTGERVPAGLEGQIILTNGKTV
jgi:RND family efflux transporter MFP subunit